MGEKYLRKDLLPFLFCPGCGNGLILHSFLKAVDDLGIIEDLALVSGIGCSSWIPFYIKADCLKILHGRTLPAATALKATRPSRRVVVFTGDGDCLAIGANHLLHAARRNIAITVIMVNNQIYAMTGGQVAPSTQVGARTQTTPYGNLERPLDGCKVALAAGATFVSRWTTAHPQSLSSALKRALEHKGFAYVEVVSQCPVQTGRYILGSGDPQVSYQWLKDYCIKAENFIEMSELEGQGKIPIGNFWEKTRPEFIAEVLRMNKRIKEARK